MPEIVLQAEAGRPLGSSASRRLRAEGKIPGVIYGGNKPAVQVALSEKELLSARKKGGVNAILHLELGKDKETVIVKELQRHPVTDRLVHADFQRISMTQKIDAKVPIHIIGIASGVKNNGGLLQHELRELRVRALPTKIPQAIEIDVTALEIGQHLSVSDLKVPEGVEVLDEAGHMVVHVTTVKEEVVEAAPAAVAAAGAEGAAAPVAEPESSNTKGKKDEEGKLVKEQAKPGAPAAAKEPAKKEGK